MSFAATPKSTAKASRPTTSTRSISGTVRTYKVLTDGRRQIGAFYLPGDIFGLEIGDEHTFSAEAISRCEGARHQAQRAGRAGRARQRRRAPALGLTGRELRRVQDHILLLIKTAQERVAGFLLEMAERAASAATVELPMSRQDIADYLGPDDRDRLAHADDLENAAAIELPTSRRIVLRNRSALSRLNA